MAGKAGGAGTPPRVLDVRQALTRGEEPLGSILAAVQALQPGQDLILRAPFEPVPLYRVLAARGLDHQSRRLGPQDWEIRFVRRKGAPRPAAPPAPGGEPPPTTAQPPEGWPVQTLDNRGLEPPEPMVRTLTALEALPPGEILEIHNDRRPVFLYPHLQQRQWAYATEDLPDGSARVRIWRNGRPAD